jgi:hypothetical protein
LRVSIIGSVIASRASIASRSSRGWELPSSRAVPSVGSMSLSSAVSKTVPTVFCKGGVADGATVARVKGVVLRPATVVNTDAAVVLAVGRFR